MLVTANGKMMRMKVSDFRVIGRNTQGVKLMNMDEEDTLVSASPFQAEDEDEVPEEGMDTTDAVETQIGEPVIEEAAEGDDDSAGEEPEPEL